MVVFCVTTLLMMLGPPALAGMAVMALLVPVEARIAKATSTYRKCGGADG